MSKPLVVTIPHSLGKDEAMRRLKTGMDRIHEQFGDKIARIEQTWNGDHGDFRVGVLGQSVTGGLDVMNDSVRLEVQLPWVLSIFAEKAKGLIQKQGTLMLEKK